MKVGFTTTALIEIDDIFAYLAAHNTKAVRIIPLGPYPFLIFYIVEQDEVVILHVRHAAREWPWKENR